MSNDEVGLPKNAIAAAITIIFLHWSGASFSSSNLASTWLGVVQIERDWIVGVFLHIWLIVAFLLYWQRIGAPPYRTLQQKHLEICTLELVQRVSGSIPIIAEAAEAIDTSVSEQVGTSVTSLVGRFAKRNLVVKVGAGQKNYIPYIGRTGIVKYVIDFSRLGHVLSSSSGSDKAGLPELHDLPLVAIPDRFRWRFFLLEIRTLRSILTTNIQWYREFLPWLLGWFAVCSVVYRWFIG